MDKHNINLWCKHLLQEMKVAVEVLKHSLSNATIPSQMTSHKLVFIMLEFDDIEYSALSDLDLYVVVWLNLLLHMYNIYVGNKDITTLYLNAFFILLIYLYFFLKGVSGGLGILLFCSLPGPRVQVSISDHLLFIVSVCL